MRERVVNIGEFKKKLAEEEIKRKRELRL